MIIHIPTVTFAIFYLGASWSSGFIHHVSLICQSDAKVRGFETWSFSFFLLSHEKNCKTTNVSWQEENKTVRECAGAARHAGATKKKKRNNRQADQE